MTSEVTRAEQLRRAKRAQREQERRAGLVNVQLVLLRAIAAKLAVARRAADFPDLLDDALDQLIVHLPDYPQLHQLAWNRTDEYLAAKEAFQLYERNWRFVEPRESRDIDFLCSSRTGFRSLRETVTDRSFGAIFRKSVDLARDVRTDRDGIRTFLNVGDVPIKFEIFLEGRIDLEGAIDEKLGIPTLRREWVIAETFLANADRGLDESTLSRDLVDLAFIAAHAGRRSLGVEDTQTLRKGLQLLSRLGQEPKRAV